MGEKEEAKKDKESGLIINLLYSLNDLVSTNRHLISTYKNQLNSLGRGVFSDEKKTEEKIDGNIRKEPVSVVEKLQYLAEIVENNNYNLSQLNQDFIKLV